MAREKFKQPNGKKKTTSRSVREQALNAFHIDASDDEYGVLESDNTAQQEIEDEDIDSDEAFGSSDEETYSTFKFAGSSSKKAKVNLAKCNR